jgi:hypothetical protein
MKRDLFTELIPNQFYQRIVETKSEARKQIVIEKRKELSYKDKLIQACNQSLNRRWADGRIYHLDSNGNYASHSVSPYSKSFLDNIEDKIKDLVLALKSKGYLTISSCEGHSIYFKRYVTVIFPDKESATQFRAQLPFNLKYKLQHAVEVLNNNLEIDDYGNIIKNTKDHGNQQLDQAIDYISCFAKRPYQDAWLLEIIISEQLLSDQNIFYYFKNLKEIFFKTFLIDRFTKKLTNYILSSKFLPNIY